MNTQTPLLRFKSYETGIGRATALQQNTVDVHSLKEGSDFDFTPGGVTRMVFPLLSQMLSKGLLSDPHWVSLNPAAPQRLAISGITIHHVSLVRERTKGYGVAKEVIWRVFHGLGRAAQSELLWADNYVDYTYYNRVSSELIRSLDSSEDFDLFYIHDFQQLPVGRMLQTLKPKVLRWHIPFEESMIPRAWRNFLSTYLNSYDAVVVSCRKYLDSLKSFGYKGESFYVYPYVDQTVYRKPSPQDLDELKSKLQLRDGDRIILLVARLDPMKGQDAAIKAMPKILDGFRNAKMILVGNGSFSSSRQGLGLSKSERWLDELRRLAESLNVEDRVVFAGHLPQRLLNAAFDLCEMTMLPSRQEGFGLVAVESWLYSKPTLVSAKAGIAELVEDGKNGLLIDPGDQTNIAAKVLAILADPASSQRLGENGFLTSRRCLIDAGIQAEWEILHRLV